MKTYWFRFGSGDPRTYTGLTPTLLFFKQADNTSVTPPALAEASGTGMYYFSYGTTVPIAFLADAATTSPGVTGRYVSGSIDPADRVDEYGSTMIALGTTNVALGVSGIAQAVTIIAQNVTLLAAINVLSTSIPGIGSTASSFGTSSADPVDLFGYMKRIVENLEGNQNFIKTSGALSIVTRASTGSVTLAVKTITNSVSMVVKT